MLHFVLVIVAAAQLSVAMPAYTTSLKASRVAEKSNFCVLPQEFVVRDFHVWIPQADDNSSIIINFGYTDDSVMPAIVTECHLNQTSINVGAAGLAPRYACDNALVNFIWSKGTLTLIEKACPHETQSRPYEATGVLKPKLNCFKSMRDSKIGGGVACASTPKVMSAEFISLQPTPN
ncbi:hypothetical protein P885DRAFT_75630 [Corynascus similis CBS 632.67]